MKNWNEINMFVWRLYRVLKEKKKKQSLQIKNLLAESS